MERIRVLLVDDHAIFRRGVASVLATNDRLEVVGQAADGLEAIEKAKELTPDVVLMDLNMPRCGGLEATSALQATLPQINVLVLTVSEREDDLFAAIKSGAKGYLLKHADPEELIQAVFHVAQGRRHHLFRPGLQAAHRAQDGRGPSRSPGRWPHPAGG